MDEARRHDQSSLSSGNSEHAGRKTIVGIFHVLIPMRNRVA
jgi:hypothetical protein